MSNKRTKHRERTPAQDKSVNPLQFETSLGGIQHFIIDHTDSLDQVEVAKLFRKISAMGKKDGSNARELGLAATIFLAEFCGAICVDPTLIAAAKAYSNRVYPTITSTVLG